MCVRRAAIAAALFVATLVVAVPRAHADDPTLGYHTITTPHFFVHYHDGIEALADKTAVVCEEAHALLSPLLDWAPRRRTHVFVEDKTDTANGFASVFGRQAITIWGMPPESDSVLGFYDDWLRVLVFHEYVHILHLDTTHGLPPLVNAVLGKQWVPNQTLPRWYIEGLATYYESKVTRGGRVNGALFDMYLRAAALDGKFDQIDEATGLPSDWPGGTVAYLYGGFFLDYVFGKYGDQMGTKFNHRYGTRVFPWGMNSIARDLSGQSFDELWSEFAAATAGRAHARRIGVIARGATPVHPVTTRGGTTGFPVRRPGTNEVWFQQFDLESSPRLSRVLTTGGVVETVTELDTTSGPMAWSPDGELLVFSQSTSYKNAYRWSDLYAYHVPTRSIRRLTHGERAREPAVSPDGARIAYVRSREGTMELVVAPIRSRAAAREVIVSGLAAESGDGERWQQIATPTWSPNGRSIAFSRWTGEDGQRDIWIWSADSTTLHRVTDDFSVDLDPRFDADGRLLFSSDRDGIFNIYEHDLTTGTTRRLSNVVVGVFGPDPTPDRQWLFVGTYGADGYDLGRIRRTEWAEATDAPDSLHDDLPPVDYPEIDTATFERDDYSPGRFLAPLVWRPQLGVVTSGAGFGAVVEGYDPVGRHVYSVDAGLTTGREFTDYGANAGLFYQYNRLPFPIAVAGSFRDTPRTRSLFAGGEWQPIIERELSATARLTYPFRALADTLSLSLAFEVNHSRMAEAAPYDIEPADFETVAPEAGWFNDLSFTASYSNTRGYPQGVSTAQGWSASTTVDVVDPALGADFHEVRLRYGFDGFLPNPLLARHVLAFSLDGAIVASDMRSPRRYSVGGNSPQDVFASVVQQQQRREFVVRGYPPNIVSGAAFQIAGLQYRFPILDLDHGFSTLPLFFRQLKGSAFVETGAAYDGFIADAELLTGIGTELVLESVFAYYLFGNLRLGYARGLGPEGIHEVYALFGGGF